MREEVVAISSCWHGAVLVLLCIVILAPGAFATCSPSGPQGTCAPGETLVLDYTPEEPSWSYQWIVREGDGDGEIIHQQSGEPLSFTVPVSGYADAYYINLVVINGRCSGEDCKLFLVELPTECSIASDQPTTVYIFSSNAYSYSTKSTPGQFNQRWWIFPEDKFPEDPSKISYQGHQNRRVGDGNSITVLWSDLADLPGKYIVSTGYYDKSPPYRYRGSCQLGIILMDKLSVDISMHSG